MHRIDTSGSIDGKFSDGNPNIGQIATLLGAAFMNDLQENVCFLIESQGIVLEKGKETQLADAIAAYVVGAVGTGDAEVPTTRKINVSGLVTGGGNLAADRTITVTAATGAEVKAGLRNDVAITPAALLGGVGARSLTATGYATLMGGVIFQWGSTVVGGNSYATITLPTAFPSQCFFAGVEGGIAAGNAQDNAPIVTGRSAGTITVFNAQDPSVSCNWLAVGV